MSDAEHAVIVRYALSADGFGTTDDRRAIRGLEEKLAQAIEEAGVGEFDGNEFGGGEVTLWAYGPDADALFAVMKPLVSAHAARPAWAMLRYGSAGDPMAREKRVDL